MFDGPSKLGQDLGVAIVDELADQDIIPFYTYWLRAIGGVVSPCSTDWPRTVKEVLTPLSTDRPAWYLTHLTQAGQASKKLIVNQLASLYSPCQLPVLNRLASHFIVTIVNELASHLSYPLYMDWPDLYCTHCRLTGWSDNNSIVNGLARPVLYPFLTSWPAGQE